MSGSAFFMLLIFLPLIFLPTIIAIKKNHKYKIPIVLVNVFGGFLFGIGWLVALIWCFIEPSNYNVATDSKVSSDIEKLHALKENGVLTEEEFSQKKKELLGI